MKILGTPLVEYLPALALLVLTAIYLATGYGYTPESRAFPITVGWAALLLGIVDIVSRTQTPIGHAIVRRLNPAAAPEKADAHPHYPVGKQIQAVLWALGFVALIATIGILYAVPAYVFASLLLRGRRSLLTCLVTAAGVTLFVYLLFVQLLMIELYPGMLFADY
jgi:hypothetical protein